MGSARAEVAPIKTKNSSVSIYIKGFKQETLKQYETGCNRRLTESESGDREFKSLRLHNLFNTVQRLYFTLHFAPTKRAPFNA